MPTSSRNTLTEEVIVRPDFLVTCTDGQTVTDDLRLSDMTTALVLYFYPKDSTAGCTTQANDFTARLEQFAALGYQVIGVSRDSIASHDKFIAKQHIGFSLISDPDEVLCQHFNVIREKNMYGKKVLGVQRSTFVFAADGQLLHALRNVRAKGHVDRVLALL